MSPRFQAACWVVKTARMASDCSSGAADVMAAGVPFPAWAIRPSATPRAQPIAASARIERVVLRILPSGRPPLPGGLFSTCYALKDQPDSTSELWCSARADDKMFPEASDAFRHDPCDLDRCSGTVRAVLLAGFTHRSRCTARIRAGSGRRQPRYRDPPWRRLSLPGPASQIDSGSARGPFRPRLGSTVLQYHPGHRDAGIGAHDRSGRLGRERAGPLRTLRCSAGRQATSGNPGASSVDSLLLGTVHSFAEACFDSD